jgi:SAM-dependent methyltransferase
MLSAPEKWFPLRVLVCESCWLVQTEDFAQADELFDSEYAYFSGFSASWVKHCGDYVDMMIRRFGLDGSSHFVEVASNDGTLLAFAADAGIRATGIEPTGSTAQAARAKGLTVVERFLGSDSAVDISEEFGQADVVAANNVLAHVPDINGFVDGVRLLLRDTGVVTFEFPHLVNLVAENQFDTIYHEHFSYLSLTSVAKILESVGLRVFDVEKLPTHGGSLRVFAQHVQTGPYEVVDSVAALLADEDARGLQTSSYYEAFQRSAENVKNTAMRFLIDASERGDVVVAYGAAAKGNTLLNFAGVRPDLIRFVADLNPAKQGKSMPGSRVPIVGPDALVEADPDYVVILPWNLRTEVSNQLAELRSRGTKIVTFIPVLEVS